MLTIGFRKRRPLGNLGVAYFLAAVTKGAESTDTKTGNRVIFFQNTDSDFQHRTGVLSLKIHVMNQIISVNFRGRKGAHLKCRDFSRGVEGRGGAWVRG